MTHPVIKEDECTACENCVDACPNEVIAIVDGVAKVMNEECVACDACIDECPSAAITEIVED